MKKLSLFENYIKYFYNKDNNSISFQMEVISMFHKETQDTIRVIDFKIIYN